VDLITCWVLSTGPCGLACSPIDVGRNTGVDVFGNFTAVVKIYTGTGHIINIIHWLDSVRRNFTQMVFDVNANNGWEQERTSFTFKLEPNISSEDLRYSINVNTIVVYA